MPPILETLIDRCIARNQQSRYPHKTHYTRNTGHIYYATRDGKLQSATPKDFENAKIGIMPIAKNGYAIEQYAASVGKNWKTRYGFDDWELASWKRSYGVQVYTGEPSRYLTDLDFEIDIVREHPDLLIQTLAALWDLIKCPLITISKSGGIRLSARTPEYIHPRSTEQREYIATYNQETGEREALYLEIFGEKGLSRWDARYEIATGNLFDLPVIYDTDALFEIIDTLKSKIHRPPPKKKRKPPKQKRNAQSKKTQTPDVEMVDGLPADLNWIPTGEKDKYKSNRGNYRCHFTKHTKSHGAVQYYKDTQTDAISEFCHNCREWQWIQKPKQNRTAPDRLHIQKQHHRPTQAYQKTQDTMTQQLVKWEKRTRNTNTQHILNIITPAQTGKTTITITTAEKLTYITQTQKKAEEAHQLAVETGKDAYLHKSRMYNREHPNWNNLPIGTDQDSRPCIHPHTCNNIAEKGFTPAKDFCRTHCEKYDTCKSSGYLSQQQKEKLAQHVYFWQDEAFFADEIYRSRVQAVTEDRDALLVIDEPNPADLPQHRTINTTALRHTFNTIKYSPAAYETALFLKTLLEELATAQTETDIRTALKNATQNLSEKESKQLDEKLSGIPVNFIWKRQTTGKLQADVICNDKTITAVVVDDDDPTPGTIPQSIIQDGVTLDTIDTRYIGLALYQRLGFIDLRTESETTPRVYRNLIQDITRFVKSNSNASSRTDENTIAFYLPPALNARRGITLNASDTDNLIGEVYKPTPITVDTITAEPPEWKHGCKLYQISTGRYPPNSLFTFKGKGKDKACVGITNTMNDFLKIIRNTAEKHNVLVIGAKRLQNNEIHPMIDTLNQHQNITLDTHKGAQGKNEYQDRDVAFIFCFEPQPKVVREETRRIYPHATDLSFERQNVDVIVDGITLKDAMRYTDERVQKVYNLLCERMHMQAIYRLRQALNAHKIAVLFSAEPVSQIPTTPVPFRKEQILTYQETENWDISELQTYLKAEANRTPKQIAKTENVSIRTAYYKSEQTRKQTKTEKKARAKELDKQKTPVEKIIAELNISRRTFFNWKENNFR